MIELLGWIVGTLALGAYLTMAVPPAVWLRMVERHTDTPPTAAAVSCVHPDGYNHRARRRRGRWVLCRRGHHFRITPLEDHQL